MAVMDRTQHQRYLFYLQRFEYFGRGVPKLDAETFTALDTEYRQMKPTDDAERAHKRELARQLLRD